jgi:hypothetical protein
MLFSIIHTIIDIFATVGGYFASLCIIGAGASAVAYCSGAFAEQFGPKVLKANEYNSVGYGLKYGAIIGGLFTVAAIYQLGNFAAIFSVIGLCITVYFFAGLIWFCSAWNAPINTDLD